MDKLKSVKSSVDNLPAQTFIKFKKINTIKKAVKKSNYIDSNLGKDFLFKYFQESKE